MSTPPDTTAAVEHDSPATPSGDRAEPSGDLPGWYAVPDHSAGATVAHRSESLAPGRVRPACSVASPPAGDIRAPGEGDTICRACIDVLRDAGLSLDVPLIECLGCDVLRNRAPASNTVSPHPARSADSALPNGDCAGSRLVGASFDGRDAVRREGVVGRTQTLRRIAKRTADFNSLMDGGWSFTTAASDHAESIMRLDGVVGMWDKLIGSGDYLTTLGIALASITRPFEGSNAMEAAIRRCTAAGAKGWIDAVRWKITPMLTDPAASAVTADLVENLLTRL